MSRLGANTGDNKIKSGNMVIVPSEEDARPGPTKCPDRGGTATTKSGRDHREGSSCSSRKEKHIPERHVIRL